MESKVSLHVLNLAKGLPTGGATCTYHVPEELLELTRSKKRARAEPQPVVLLEASEAAAAPGPVAAVPGMGRSEFAESTHSARITLTEELCVAPPAIAFPPLRRSLLPPALVYAIAAVIAYSMVRLLLR